MQSFKYSGYNDFYDYVFDLACDMDKADTNPFRYGGEYFDKEGS
ncbi:hypothetical protein [Oceanirhabdus sp. W0125-5]|nr:hypothetical protein [Oceanirhabdus sp. W0125-5]WBW98159.1 hypothetical protein OW730_05175 [Oceanirhabdus sp. W0125-5]